MAPRKGLDAEHRALHLGQEGRAREWLLGVAAEGLSRPGRDPLSAGRRSHLGQRALPERSTIRTCLLLRGAEDRNEGPTAEPRRGRSRDSGAPTRSSAFPLARAGTMLAGRRRRRGVRFSVSVATTFKATLAEEGRDLLRRCRRRCASIPSWCASYLGIGRTLRRQFAFATLNSAVFSDGSFAYTSRRACAARWSCPPISASTPRTPASSSAR